MRERKLSVLKRLLDIMVSLASLVVLTPFFGVVSLLVKLDTSGPIFYRGFRAGLNGRPFRIFKFRTMVVNAENLGGSATPNDDPRITRAGKVLRRFKLDELPQFINVLKGEMSLVGPRPEIQRYVDMYTLQQKAILTVRPGITDWASLWDFDEGSILEGSLDPEKTYMEIIRPEKIRLQLAYVRNRSLWVDLVILFRTLLAVTLRIRPRETSITGGD